MSMDLPTVIEYEPSMERFNPTHELSIMRQELVSLVAELAARSGVNRDSDILLKLYAQGRLLLGNVDRLLGFLAEGVATWSETWQECVVSAWAEIAELREEFYVDCQALAIDQELYASTEPLYGSRVEAYQEQVEQIVTELDQRFAEVEEKLNPSREPTEALYLGLGVLTQMDELRHWLFAQKRNELPRAAHRDKLENDWQRIKLAILLFESVCNDESTTDPRSQAGRSPLATREVDAPQGGTLFSERGHLILSGRVGRDLRRVVVPRNGAASSLAGMSFESVVSLMQDSLAQVDELRSSLPEKPDLDTMITVQRCAQELKRNDLPLHEIVTADGYPVRVPLYYTAEMNLKSIAVLLSNALDAEDQLLK